MKNLKLSLTKQLIIIITLLFLIITVSLIIILPKSLEPFFEQTVYSYLENPLKVFDGTQNKNRKYENIAYIQYVNDEIYISSNYKEILKIKDYKKILDYIDISGTRNSRGKFTYKNKDYYYFVYNKSYNIKIAITTDNYIKNLRNNVFAIIIPILVITFLIILILLLLWSDLLVVKIGNLKQKILNMTDPNFKIQKNKFEFDDELKLLDKTIDNMKEIILENEKFRREMYQNISHDFKTPITVVKSYAESYYDGIKNADEVIKVTEEQMNKLENKVKTLLEFNKIIYLQNSYKNDKTIDVLPIVKSEIEKYKIINKNLNYELIHNKKKYIFNGSEDMWESVIDNILSNAIRYAKEKIVITLKEDRISFYNDGEKIKPALLKDLFLPYKKGFKGENGLGLSIVKENCDLMKYNISVKNKKIGVEFIISK